MKIKKETLKYLLLIVAILVVGVGIAYAALSTTLSITFGNVTQSAVSWNVAFQGSSATATEGGTSSTGRSCGTATITTSTVTVANTTLSKPGDKCTYELTIKNNGTIGATLGTITPTAPTSTTCEIATNGNLTCGNITYKLTTDSTGATELTTGGTIAAGGSQTIYLVISYNANTVQSSPITQSGAQFALIYNQA